MSKDWYDDMVQFHKIVMCDDFPTFPHIPNEKYKKLRVSLITEEVGETLRAIDEDDLVEIADGIADAIVILLGTAVTYGIDLRPIWDEVHRTNMSKADGEMRSDGKRLKPIGFVPPNVARILREQLKAYYRDNDE